MCINCADVVWSFCCTCYLLGSPIWACRTDFTRGLTFSDHLSIRRVGDEEWPGCKPPPLELNDNISVMCVFLRMRLCLEFMRASSIDFYFIEVEEKKCRNPPVTQNSLRQHFGTMEGWVQTAEKYWFDTCHWCFVNMLGIFLPQFRKIAASCRNAATMTNSSKRLCLAGRDGNTFRLCSFCK